MRKSRLRPVSKKRAKQLREERKVRPQLEARADGVCETCGMAPDFRGLHPHERVFRSHGGLMTMENSVMDCGRCHSVEHRVREVCSYGDEGSTTAVTQAH